MSFSPECGVCTLHVRPQHDYLVLTVTSAYFPAHGFRPNRTGPSVCCIGPEKALAAIRQFLESYTEDSL
jgi:hypothetical protein